MFDNLSPADLEFLEYFLEHHNASNLAHFDGVFHGMVCVNQGRVYEIVDINSEDLHNNPSEESIERYKSVGSEHLRAVAKTIESNNVQPNLDGSPEQTIWWLKGFGESLQVVDFSLPNLVLVESYLFHDKNTPIAKKLAAFVYDFDDAELAKAGLQQASSVIKEARETVKREVQGQSSEENIMMLSEVVTKAFAMWLRLDDVQEIARKLVGGFVEEDVVSKPSSKISRNDPCYCGSGVKYKYCHGNPKRHIKT